MTEPDAEATAHPLYAEPGSTWWPVLWGPIFAVLGAVVEGLAGPVHVIAWVLIGLGLAVAALVWVQARRRVCSVRLSHLALYQGREQLTVDRIAEVDEVGTPIGAKILGGGWTVPKKFGEVPLRLTDDTVVIAWAKDPEALRAALRPLLRS
jgi:hypothetical protein